MEIFIGVTYERGSKRLEFIALGFWFLRSFLGIKLAMRPTIMSTVFLVFLSWIAEIHSFPLNVAPELSL
jgi:hypothetical protein